MEIKLIGYCKECNRKMIFDYMFTKNQPVEAKFLCLNKVCKEKRKARDGSLIYQLTKSEMKQFRNTELLLDYLRGNNQKKLERKYKLNVSSVNRILKEYNDGLNEFQKEKIYKTILNEYEYEPARILLEPWKSRKDLFRLHDIIAKLNLKSKFW